MLILAGIYTPSYKFLNYSAIFGHGDNPARPIKTSAFYFLDKSRIVAFQPFILYQIIRQRQAMEGHLLRRRLRDLPGAGYSFVCQDDEVAESGKPENLGLTTF